MKKWRECQTENMEENWYQEPWTWKDTFLAVLLFSSVPIGWALAIFIFIFGV